MRRFSFDSIAFLGRFKLGPPCLAVMLVWPMAAAAGERGLLWRVIQACLADHRVTGAAFPCLSVDLGNDPSRGTVVVRAPFEASHIIVTPAVRTVGIEAPALRASTAPNYFADAWNARRFVSDALPRQPKREDLGMAVNSRVGRSQDQLHIHVDCLRPDIRASLDRQLGSLRQGAWSALTLTPRTPRYAVTLLDEAAFPRANIVALAQRGLELSTAEMDGLTVVVAPVVLHDAPGFAVLARHRIPHSRDEAHGEALLDHGCAILH